MDGRRASEFELDGNVLSLASASLAAGGVLRSFFPDLSGSFSVRSQKHVFLFQLWIYLGRLALLDRRGRLVTVVGGTYRGV